MKFVAAASSRSGHNPKRKRGALIASLTLRVATSAIVPSTTPVHQPSRYTSLRSFSFSGQSMSTSPSSTSNQFSIKRLFWTMIVASVVFKLADLVGLLDLIAGNWEFARGNSRAGIIVSIIIFTVIAVVYIGWLGIRLPYLIEQYLVLKKKRDQRRKQFEKELEVHRDQ